MKNSSNFINKDDLILITGANGFIGKKLVGNLLERGFTNLRFFARPSGDLTHLESIIADHPDRNIDIVKGNLLSRDDCREATRGAVVVYHLAAGKEKTFPGSFMNSVVTTKNLLEEIAAENCIKRFVNVSSFAVYANYKVKRGALVDESCPVDENSHMAHEAYIYGKEKQDEIVDHYHVTRGLPCVTVRPGVVFGPGKNQVTGRVGIDTFGIFLHLGGSNVLPITYVDNCADAFALAGLTDNIDGEVINILDDDLPTSRKFLRLYKNHVRKFRSIYIPYRLFYFLCYLWERYSIYSENQLPPAFNTRMCSIYWKGNKYTNAKAKRLLGWQPSVPMNESMMRFFEYCAQEGRKK
jgi:nucleoside-diphosphate-sugar epimerase